MMRDECENEPSCLVTPCVTTGAEFQWGNHNGNEFAMPNVYGMAFCSPLVNARRRGGSISPTSKIKNLKESPLATASHLAESTPVVGLTRKNTMKINTLLPKDVPYSQAGRWGNPSKNAPVRKWVDQENAGGAPAKRTIVSNFEPAIAIKLVP
jgi:hypothetical protein